MKSLGGRILMGDENCVGCVHTVCENGNPVCMHQFGPRFFVFTCTRRNTYAARPAEAKRERAAERKAEYA